ncbi:hypothetical protein CTRI78_v011468 [Colletotrichum trifolii]|uniref:Secreted protein n=1 Tax=Colletotrichum trifolii TaxID=5466 RepID=A0A4R8QAC4_COLTR|nr:hypothetical protein CTRI78_v011468 [Colletotrichum trifolii]
MRTMFARLFYILASLALFAFPLALANEHSQCWCVTDTNQGRNSHKVLTERACEIYRNTMRIFEDDEPQKVNVTMLWHLCATIAPRDGRMRWVSGFGGKEFMNACLQAKSAGVAPDVANLDVGSECD